MLQCHSRVGRPDRRTVPVHSAGGLPHGKECPSPLGTFCPSAKNAACPANTASSLLRCSRACEGTLHSTRPNDLKTYKTGFPRPLLTSFHWARDTGRENRSFQADVQAWPTIRGQCYRQTKHSCCDTGSVYDPGSHQCCVINGVQSYAATAPLHLFF